MLTIIASTFLSCQSKDPCPEVFNYYEDFPFTIVVDNQTDSVHTATAVICCPMSEYLDCDGGCKQPYNVEANSIDTLFKTTRSESLKCDGIQIGGTAYITALVIPKDSEIIFPDSTKIEVTMAEANNEIYYIVRYKSL